MNYESLNAIQLRELCNAKGVKPSRAKADMIADLKARDALSEDKTFDTTDTLTLTDAVLTLAEDTTEEVHEEPAPEPAQGRTWVGDGFFFESFPRDGRLTDPAHKNFIDTTELDARKAGYQLRSGANRVSDEDTTIWVYQVGVL
jgi:hypothetical protein